MKIAIYGAGNYGQYVYDELIKNEHAKISAVCWIDNFVKEKVFRDLPVYTEEKFFQDRRSAEVDAIVVAVKNIRNNLTSQKIVLSLLLRGYEQIYVALPEFYQSRLPVLDAAGNLSRFIRYFRDIKPTDRIMSSLVAEHCNLNCKRCGNYSNLVKEKSFLGLERFEAYLVQLKKKFRTILRFHLLGGEPLLNPQLDRYIALTRKYLHDTEIDIITNGLLIPNMSSRLIDTIQECNAVCWISQYPPTISRLDPIVDHLEKNHISYLFTPPRTQFRRWITLKEETGDKAFERWRSGDCGCHAIVDGRVYACCCIPKIYDMREYLGIHIEERELMDSSIDLMDDDIDGWDILKYTSHASPICRFCSPDEVLEKWETGQPDRSDWIVS